MEVRRKQSTPNFPKNEHFLPPDTHIRGQKMFAFRNIWRPLLSCYLRFEIRSFALLPTIYWDIAQRCQRKLHLGFFIYVGTGINKPEIVFVSAYRGVFITQLNMYDDSFCFHPLTYFAENLHRRFSTGFYIHLRLTHIW